MLEEKRGLEVLAARRAEEAAPLFVLTDSPEGDDTGAVAWVSEKADHPRRSSDIVPGSGGAQFGDEWEGGGSWDEEAAESGRAETAEPGHARADNRDVLGLDRRGDL